jgi:hypothetical protein
MVHIHDTSNHKENDAVRNKKEKVVQVPLLISSSEAVQNIVKKIIPEHYPDLVGANILCLCRNKASKAAGIPIPGAIRKANPTERYLTSKEGDDGSTYVLTVALDVWNDLQPNQRLALVDHLLAKCVAIADETTGDYKYGLRPPQVQEFPEVAERNGKWNQGLIELGDALRP